MNTQTRKDAPASGPAGAERGGEEAAAASRDQSPPSRPLSLLRRVFAQSRVAFYFIVVMLVLVLLVIAGVAIGSTSLDADVVVRVLAARVLPEGWIDVSGIGEAEQVIVLLVRLPRVVVAALVGAGLAVAGAQMQGLFRNPLASPEVTGASAGGALGAVLALAMGLAARSLFYLPLFAVVGSLCALFAVYFIATQRGRTPVATLLLAGIALGSLTGAITSFLITATWVRYEVAQEILFWLLGGLDNRTWEHVMVVLPPVVFGTLAALFYARELDLLLAGEELAQSLGVEVETAKRFVLLNAALLTGAAVAVSGTIGFVGLVVPHIVRLLIGPAHRRLIPASALTGAAFLVAADLLARTLIRPEEIRLGIVTAFCGAPFFLYLLIRHRREVGYT